MQEGVKKSLKKGTVMLSPSAEGRSICFILSEDKQKQIPRPEPSGLGMTKTRKSSLVRFAAVRHARDPNQLGSIIFAARAA
jgi:hypothetical protein